MFTGLVQGKGRVEAVDGGAETRFRIRTLFDAADIRKGESVAVNGVCLTVETFGGQTFTAYASRETLDVTNLDRLKPGSQVNLERALAAGDRLGGHLVSGHVDCLAVVSGVKPAGQSKVFKLTFPKEFSNLVIQKGSVALDGVSLTVNLCGEDWLSVNIIPATQKETTISEWRPGYEANMETDLIGRYVQRMLGPWAERLAEGSGPGMSREFLAKHGF
ncbi:MAG: riboflavin synthase [Desulfovibrionaceae bacterium]|nr:riboflavin synthase [Desulfovibrionaceae bacterium]MDD4951060.1 riboflavin synthase [Desulfovibrionaceae bacterium]